MADTRKPVEPNSPRWKPSNDPSSINIPGLDKDASVTDQVEQIEQLITIKLQNIDENFSKIHNVLATRILPAVKRYSIGTEPVREAAKFWTSFYERAAQIRIPTYDEHSTVNEIPESQDEEASNEDQDQTVQFNNRDPLDSRTGFEPSIAHTDSSFMPQDALSSTPATTRQAQSMDSFASHGSNDPSWANSIQSPLLRLKSEIQNLTSEDDSIITSSSDQSAAGFLQETPGPDRHNSTVLPPPSTAKAAPKSKGKEPELLRNVLKHNLYNASADEFTMKNVSPLKFKPKTPVPKQYNPYLSSGSDSSNWSGVVDLRDPNVLSPKKGHHSSKASSSRHPKTPAKDDSDDDSFDGLPKGMSPPVLMSPARPPRSSAELGLHRIGQSPSKQAVSRIVNDTMRDVQANSAYKSRSYYGSGFVESSMSTIESPPSMSKYRGDETSQSYVDSTIDSMMRRVGLDVPQRSGLNSTPGLKVRSKARDSLGRGRTQHSAADSSADDSFPAIDLNQGNQLFTPGYDYRGQDMDSDSDSLEDEINNTAHPSAAFLMASQGRPGDDDSFGSSNHSSDSLDEDVDVGALGVVPVHPFGGSTVEDDGLDSDDSFDYQGSDVQEETVFGVPPAQRLRAAQAAQRQHDLRLHGEGLLDDTIGVQIVAGNMGVEESPTPAGWGGDELRH